jgi:hypothetical protein
MGTVQKEDGETRRKMIVNTVKGTNKPRRRNKTKSQQSQNSKNTYIDFFCVVFFVQFLEEENHREKATNEEQNISTYRGHKLRGSYEKKKETITTRKPDGKKQTNKPSTDWAWELNRLPARPKSPIRISP